MNGWCVCVGVCASSYTQNVRKPLDLTHFNLSNECSINKLKRVAVGCLYQANQQVCKYASYVMDRWTDNSLIGGSGKKYMLCSL